MCACLIVLWGKVSAQQKGKILFISDRDGNAEIYVVDDDGTNLKRLTNTNTLEASPVWSPDGTQIAFIARSEDMEATVRVMSADGASDSLLAGIGVFQFGGGVAWSPDGKKLLCPENKGGNPDICLINADGSDKKNLTQHSAIDVSPSFSPDGKKIAFASNRDDNFEIYAMDTNGGNLTRLTNTPEREGFPAFSPDGKRIAYYLYRNNLSEVRIMNADGTGDTKVMDTGTARRGGLCWAPDGKRIAYTTDQDGNREVYTANVDGSDPRNVSQNAASDTEPSWWAAK
jgi:TolB protein